MNGGTGDSAQPKGSIGLISCLAFAVGSMVGGGVFVLSGPAVNEAGPAALLCYLIAAVVMLLSAISFVAVAARAKPGDSGYGPVGDLLGPMWRFLVMWGFYINALASLAFLLVSFGSYLNQNFLAAVGPTATALGAAVLVSALNLGPAALVAKAETAIVGLKVGLLLVLVAWGLANVGDVRFTPFSPGGSSGILEVSALLFTAYTGFNIVTNMAGSVRNASRTVPLAVLGSILISGLIYCGVIVAMLASGVHHFGASGVGDAAKALMGNWGGYLIAFAACLSTLSGANANMLSTGELVLRLVKQGDAPPVAARAGHSGNPFVSVLFAFAVAVLLVLVAPINTVIVYANVGALVAMIVVNVAAIQLARKGWPGEGLRIPGGAILPVMAIVACLIQFPSLGWGKVAIGLAMVFGGLLIYAVRHDRHFDKDARRLADEAITAIDTPLARAMRGIEFFGRKVARDA